MVTTTVSTLITHGVVLEHGNYGRELTITKSGVIEGPTYGVYANTNLVVLVNDGRIRAGEVAVDLRFQSQVENSGVIYGTSFGVVLGENGRMLNTGTVGAGAEIAVWVDHGGSLGNTGLITSKNAGVLLGKAVKFSNSGHVYGKSVGVATVSDDSFVNTGKVSGGADYGVGLRGASKLVNEGDINGTNIGVVIATGTLINEGGIEGQTVGIYVAGTTSGADYIANAATGTISSQEIGLVMNAETGHPLSITNAGEITGKLAGAYLTNAFLTNTGKIEGGTVGVYLKRGGLTNAGTISGSSFAVVLAGDATLSLDPGSLLKGAVTDLADTGSLYLGGAKAAATLIGVGSSFTGFSNISFGRTANWIVEGDLAGLASGQTITNFSGYDIGQHTIVLTDFAAADGYFASGIGSKRHFTLSNGATTEVMTFALPDGEATHIDVYTENGKTYLIADAYGVTPHFDITPGKTSLINGPTSLSVTPGEGSDALGITIGAAGTVATTSGPAIFTPLKVKTAEIFNYGLIESAAHVAAENLHAITNAGTIIGTLDTDILHNSGVLLGQVSAVTAFNTGTIRGELEGSYVNNSGLISSGSTAVRIWISGSSYFSHSSDIIGKTYGVYMDDKSTNFGDVFGGAVGIFASRYSVVDNYGSIGGGNDGIKIGYDATILNAGTISGATYAIDATTTFYGAIIPDLHVEVEPGAVFQGAVKDADGGGQLRLGGSIAGSLDMGISFIGFDALSFAGGSTWQLEGSIGELAAGQTITGFGRADTIVLDGFAAISDSYVPEAGLELSNGTVRVTLDITGNFTTEKFAVTEAAGKTTIAATSAGAAAAHHALWGGLT